MENKYFKDFDKWNEIKKNIDRNTITNILIHEKEIWWCSLGLNVGDEENGKENEFERPVLIIKKFNNRVCLVLPMSSRTGNPYFYHKIFYDNKVSYVILSQIKLISTKRLKRNISNLSNNQFKIIKAKLKEIIS